MSDHQTLHNNLAMAAVLRHNAVVARTKVYRRSFEDNARRAEELADLPYIELGAEGWAELDALNDYFNDTDQLQKQAALHVPFRFLRRHAWAIYACLTVLAVIAFWAGRASATGFGLDVDFTPTSDCAGYTLHLLAHPDAVEADVYVWGDATGTKDPTQRKVGHIAAGGVIDFVFHRGPGQYDGGVSLHYPDREPSNRTYSIVVHECPGSTTTAAPPTTPAPPIVEPRPTIVTVPPTPICSVPGHPEQPPIRCPQPTTTSSAAPMPTSTAPNGVDGPSVQPTTSSTDVPHVSGEVVPAATTVAAADILPKTGASDTVLMVWAAVFAVLFGAFLLCVRGWTSRGAAD